MIEPNTIFPTNKLQIPLCLPISYGQLSTGRSWEIVGQISESFVLDFLLGYCPHQTANNNDRLPSPYEPTTPPSVAFRFNPRFNVAYSGRNILTMNSYLNGDWGERQHERFPFELNQRFILKILLGLHSFMISVDGSPICSYKYRVTIHEIRSIHIGGNIRLEMITFREGDATLGNIDFHANNMAVSRPDISMPVGRLNYTNSVNVQTPRLPYLKYDYRFLRPFNLYLSGQIATNCSQYFVINLVAGNGVILFHLSIRPTLSEMVRNTFQYGEWQTGERTIHLEGPRFPLAPGSKFDMMISNKPDRVTCVVNGEVPFEFKQRFDPRYIAKIEIKGEDVQMSSIRYEIFN